MKKLFVEIFVFCAVFQSCGGVIASEDRASFMKNIGASTVDKIIESAGDVDIANLLMKDAEAIIQQAEENACMYEVSEDESYKAACKKETLMFCEEATECARKALCRRIAVLESLIEMDRGIEKDFIELLRQNKRLPKQFDDESLRIRRVEDIGEEGFYCIHSILLYKGDTKLLYEGTENMRLLWSEGDISILGNVKKDSPLWDPLKDLIERQKLSDIADSDYDEMKKRDEAVSSIFFDVRERLGIPKLTYEDLLK